MKPACTRHTLLTVPGRVLSTGLRTWEILPSVFIYIPSRRPGRGEGEEKKCTDLQPSERSVHLMKCHGAAVSLEGGGDGDASVGRG